MGNYWPEPDLGNRRLAEIALLIAGLQHASVLHHELGRPVNWSSRNSRSMAEESISADRTLRRNSTKLFSSLGL
jgi:hypothetical protein